MKDKIKKLIEKNEVEIDTLVEYGSELESFLVDSLRNQLSDEWLLGEIKKAFHHQFEVTLSKYESAEQYENSRFPIEIKAASEEAEKVKHNMIQNLAQGWGEEDRGKMRHVLNN